jgi:hypothetical protein
MATHDDERPTEPIVRVGEVTPSHWTVTMGDDPTPLSEHRTRSEAEAAARTHAETFGYPEILVNEKDGEQRTIIIDDPGPRPGHPGAARGNPAG